MGESVRVGESVRGLLKKWDEPRQERPWGAGLNTAP